ncbi:Collectin-11 [Branchiostoma belcheri]|nr:Collectin-11 [Branchiostoma belcheri]
MDVRAVLVMLAVLMPLLQASGQTVNVNLNIGGNAGGSGTADKSQAADNLATLLTQTEGLFQDTSLLEPLLDMSDAGQNMVIVKLLEQNKEMEGQMQEMQHEIKSLKVDNCITKTTCCNKTLEGCPSGYERFCEKPDMCYKISTGDKNYTEARSAYEVKPGTWVWEDGAKLGWDNWKQGLPSGYNLHHYAVHTDDSKWFDISGTVVTYRYILLQLGQSFPDPCAPQELTMDVRAVLVMLAVLMPLLQASGQTVNVNLNIGGNTGGSGTADKSQEANNIAKLLKQAAGLDTSQLEPQLLDMSDIGQNMVIAMLLEQNKEMQKEIKSLKIDNCVTKTTCCNKTLPVCPSGYKLYCENPDMCYKISTDGKNYTDARSACQADGGRLAMPKDKATNDFLAKAGYTNFVWIGLTDQATEGTWVWEDGTKLGTGWNNWGLGAPTQNDNLSNCATLSATNWFDSNCRAVSDLVLVDTIDNSRGVQRGVFKLPPSEVMIPIIPQTPAANTHALVTPLTNLLQLGQSFPDHCAPQELTMDVRAVLVMLAVLMPLLQASGQQVNINIGGNTGTSGKSDKSRNVLTALLLEQNKRMQDQIMELQERDREWQEQMQERDQEIQKMQQQIKNLTVDHCLTNKTCCNKTLGGCPSGYEWFRETPDMCYKFPNKTDLRNYTDAKSVCQADGGRLAMPKDKATNDFLIKNMYMEIWIGLTDEVTEGTWVWEDGTQLGTGWNNWGQVPTPNNPLHNCAALTAASQWFEGACSFNVRYVCEVKATAAP